MKNNLISVHAKSFKWASFFLPKKIFKDGSELYDFCRVLDDIADQDDNSQNKTEIFKRFKNQFLVCDEKNLFIKKIYRLIDNHKISKRVVLDLFDGIETDLKDYVEFKSKKELLIYSYRVAGTVGLMMAKILNVNSKNALKSAIDLGIAMQLTNISRDIIEDERRNRKYIHHDFQTIKKTLNLADAFYNSSFNSIKEIPINCRFAIIVARRVYREIGNKIKKKKNIIEYNNSGKIYVTNFGKTIQTFLSIIDFIKLMFTKPTNIHQMFEEHKMISEEVDLNARI